MEKELKYKQIIYYNMKKTIKGQLMEIIFASEPGSVFYFEFEPNVVKEYQGIYNRKCTTEICLVVEHKNEQHPAIKRLTKITLL